MEEIQRIFPEYENIETCAETVKDMLGVADTLASVKSLIVILAIILCNQSNKYFKFWIATTSFYIEYGT